MATVETFKLDPFWDDEYKRLNYTHEPFNNLDDVNRWISLGFTNKFTGNMCNMRNPQPSWNYKFLEYFTQLGWYNIGTCYYQMTSGIILPRHSDTYNRYVELYNLRETEHRIRRAIVFLEDWASGHYLEVNNQPIVNWTKGTGVIWEYDTPHLAANMGDTPRYTLQITGHV